MFRHQARVWNLMKAKVVAAGPQNSCPAWFELIPSLLLSFASMSYFCITMAECGLLQCVMTAATCFAVLLSC